MKLRSEKRDSRPRRPDIKPVPQATDIKKVIKPQKSFKVPTNTTTTKSSTGGRASTAADRNAKCNIKPPIVKRLVGRYEKRTRSSAKQVKPIDGKENRRGRQAKNASKSAKVDGPAPSASVAENVRSFGAKESEQNITSSSSSCRCDRQTHSSQHSNLSKCISECDSTTDYDQDLINTPSTSVVVASTLALPFLSGTPPIAAATIEAAQNSYDTISPEVDSTTDLLPDESSSASSFADNSREKQKDLPKLTLPTSTTVYHSYPTLEKTPSAPPNEVPPTAGIASGSNSTNFPSTPDLITLFDEEINKSTSTTDICAYNNFYPYNTILTQALLSEVNSLCESSDNAINEASSFLTINQTAIDNLKALTNLQHHTTNFLSGITLPKASCSSSSGNSVVTGADDDDDDDDHHHHNHHHLHHHHHGANFIHSVPSDLIASAGIGTSSHEVGSLACSGSAGDVHCHDQLETDECMEVEEIPDTRQEELVWDAFDPYVFIKHLPPLTPEMRAKCPALPLKTRSSPEFSLVLDLDETLVHCSLQELSDASFKFPVLFQVSVIRSFPITFI